MVKKRFGKVGGLSAMTFSERVIQIALSIPRGKVITYGRIARAAGGGPMAAQSITSILGKAYERGERNIPFHRIVYADGRVWIHEEYRNVRLRKYKAERIHLDQKGRVVDFENKLFNPFER